MQFTLYLQKKANDANAPQKLLKWQNNRQIASHWYQGGKQSTNIFCPLLPGFWC